MATLAVVALVNRARGRRALAIPEDAGTVELALFVVVPAAVLGAVPGGWGIVALIGNLALLGLVAVGFGFGLGAIVVWSARRLGGQLARSLLLLARAIPLLLFFSLLLFLTTELLRVAGAIAALSGVYYAISVLTDDRYREELLDEITAQLRDTFAARAAYLALRAPR